MGLPERKKRVALVTGDAIIRERKACCAMIRDRYEGTKKYVVPTFLQGNFTHVIFDPHDTGFLLHAPRSLRIYRIPRRIRDMRLRDREKCGKRS